MRSPDEREGAGSHPAVYARFVRSPGELIPSLRGEPGCVGALSLVDPQSGEAIVITLWTGAALAAGPPCDGAPISVWEVSLRV